MHTYGAARGEQIVGTTAEDQGSRDAEPRADFGGDGYSPADMLRGGNSLTHFRHLLMGAQAYSGYLYGLA
ncbi:hypothetical protein D769_20229 [Cupriavidus sp. HMR-1]|nr:hypothetical protein D769_20229 [Cupriavidus sp. HMR-1]